MPSCLVEERGRDPYAARIEFPAATDLAQIGVAGRGVEVREAGGQAVTDMAPAVGFGTWRARLHSNEYCVTFGPAR